MAVIKEWEGKFQKGVTEEAIKQYEQSLPSGSFAELVLHINGPDWVSVRQKMADKIEQGLKNDGYTPWPDNKRMTFCSLINPTITIRWTVKGGEHHTEYRGGDFRTGVTSVGPAFVVWIVIGVLAAFFAAFMINYFRLKARDKTGGIIGAPSSSPLVSTLGIAAIAGFFVYLYWLQKARKRE